MGREDEIRLIAYQIWEEERCVDGHDCEHWFRAEAMWEHQNKTGAKMPKTESEQTTKQAPKPESAKKKSKKT